VKGTVDFFEATTMADKAAHVHRPFKTLLVFVIVARRHVPAASGCVPGQWRFRQKPIEQGQIGAAVATGSDKVFKAGFDRGTAGVSGFHMPELGSPASGGSLSTRTRLIARL
jgi:hypothetical protein